VSLEPPDGGGEPSRSRRRRLDAGYARFSERDRELLGFVGEQLTVTVPQLARLCGSSYPTARSLRLRWQRAGWVEGRPLIWQGPAFVWLTRAGVQVAGSPFRALSPSPGAAAHLSAVTEVRLLVERELGLGSWECERALAKAHWRAGGSPHLPDGVLETARGRVAVEVELTLKGATRLDLILAESARRYPELWYFASPRVLPTLARLAAETPWRNITIFPFPPTAADLAWAR